jgi:metal-responsive CopG/Arc/MetJ family transcriptional regulator
MRTVQITIDEGLADEVDQAVQKLGTTRSEFTREALRGRLHRLAAEELERRHRAGYERHPVRAGELDVWEDEQVWGD